MKNYTYIIPLLCLICCVCYVFNADAMNIKVRVLSGHNLPSLHFIPVNSSYTAYSGKRKLFTLRQGDTLKISVDGNLIRISGMKKKPKVFSKLRLIGKSSACFAIKTSKDLSASVIYNDNLEVDSKAESLQLINVIDLEKYVEGAVAAEAGKDAPEEFYKVQAIISRTYALANLQRHIEEGFNLCDQVHCQAYSGMNGSKEEIRNAVIATRNKVIADSTGQVIIAAYHNNCGGQTAAAGDVWSRPLPYLEAVQDPFCCNGFHAGWEQKIALSDWLEYLKRKKLTSAFTDVTVICDTTFCYFPVKRQAIYSIPNSQLAMRTIRDDWKFKSAFFTINQVGDTLIFNGRGFGHGVGLCQEGAMQMAKYGRSYEDIIHFYYHDIIITDENTLAAFKKE